MDGILCLPLPTPEDSRVWLRVREDARLEQVVRQIEKLEDVRDVRRHPATHAVFRELEQFFCEEPRRAEEEKFEDGIVFHDRAGEAIRNSVPANGV